MRTRTSAATESPEAARLLTIPQAAEALRLGYATAYRLVQRGELLGVRVGRSRRVPVEALDAFVQARIAEAQAEVAAFSARPVARSEQSIQAGRNPACKPHDGRRKRAS